MKCLVVLAHPLEDSLCSHLAQETIKHMENKGYHVTVKDLYKENFSPLLTTKERTSYHEEQFDVSQLHDDITQLQETESLVLVFPTWWYSFPAILKGWFDRVWAPGYAYEHASDLNPIIPCLLNLKEVKVVTTLGAPWWVDLLVMRKPVKRVLKYAILGACTKRCDFKMLSLYSTDSLTETKVRDFVRKIQNTF